MAKTKATTFAEYLDGLPPVAQEKLLELRAILMELAPRAVEAIKWGNPVLEEKRILFAYTAHQSHLNFMPTHRSLAPFAAELSGYKTGKDTLQLPYHQDLPKDLIRRIALHRIQDVQEHDAKWMG